MGLRPFEFGRELVIDVDADHAFLSRPQHYIVVEGFVLTLVAALKATAVDKDQNRLARLRRTRGENIQRIQRIGTLSNISRHTDVGIGFLLILEQRDIELGGIGIGSIHDGANFADAGGDVRRHLSECGACKAHQQYGAYGKKMKTTTSGAGSNQPAFHPAHAGYGLRNEQLKGGSGGVLEGSTTGRSWPLCTDVHNGHYAQLRIMYSYRYGVTIFPLSAGLYDAGDMHIISIIRTVTQHPTKSELGSQRPWSRCCLPLQATLSHVKCAVDESENYVQ